MATLKRIREAIATIIETHTTGEVYVYDRVEDLGHLPAVIVEPLNADYEVTMAMDTTWEFNLFVLTSNAIDSAEGQSELDGFIDGVGENSIRKIIWINNNLGLNDGDATQAYVHSMRAYGGSFDWAKIKHVGAVLRIRVHTDGNE